LVSKMRAMADDVLDQNKKSVKTYLDNQIEYVEKITTYDADDEDEPNFNLVQMTKQRRHAEEARIKKNLEDIKYEIDGPNTVFAVCGRGRVDKYLLPLMSILLERHVQIITLCKEYILDNRELYTASESLYYLIEVVWKRVLALKAGFTQQRLDLDSAFEFFCNGLYDQFYTAYIRDDEDSSDSDSDDSSDSDSDDSDEDSSEDGDDVADGSVKAASPAITVPEEVVPLSVELLIFPATKVEKDVIDAQKASQSAKATEKKDVTAEAKDDGSPAAAPKTVEERLGSLEEQMTKIQESLKELLQRLPPRRR